jgi:hypothetical protein
MILNNQATPTNSKMREESTIKALCHKNTNNIPTARYWRHHIVTLMAKQEHSS